MLDKVAQDATYHILHVSVGGNDPELPAAVQLANLDAATAAAGGSRE
jgi:hypothetical protein